MQKSLFVATSNHIYSRHSVIYTYKIRFSLSATFFTIAKKQGETSNKIFGKNKENSNSTMAVTKVSSDLITK